MSSSGLNRIAPDAWPLIQAFRESGGRAFESFTPEEARRNYVESCARNSVPRVEQAEIRDSVVGRSRSIPARLYVPRDAPANPPVIFFLHGGGWVIGGLETHDGICRRLADGSKAAVLAIDYRLAPEHPYPAAIDDAREALEWLLGAPDELGFAPQSVAIVGDSAGGGMAAVLAQEVTAGSASPSVQAQVLLYPVVDLTMSTDSYQRVREGFPLTASTMSWFADLYAPNIQDRTEPALSPLLGVQPDAPVPAFVCTVGQDPLADEGIAYAGAIARAGGHVEHVHLPGYAHGLFTSAGRIPTGSVILDRVCTFLATAFQRD